MAADFTYALEMFAQQSEDNVTVDRDRDATNSDHALSTEPLLRALQESLLSRQSQREQLFELRMKIRAERLQREQTRQLEREHKQDTESDEGGADQTDDDEEEKRQE
jgi:hypothetical protein